MKVKVLHNWTGNSEHAQRGIAGLKIASCADLTSKL